MCIGARTQPVNVSEQVNAPSSGFLYHIVFAPFHIRIRCFSFTVSLLFLFVFAFVCESTSYSAHCSTLCRPFSALPNVSPSNPPLQCWDDAGAQKGEPAQLQQYQHWRGGGRGEERRGGKTGREERIGRACEKERRGRKGKREREERMRWRRGENGREGMF